MAINLFSLIFLCVSGFSHTTLLLETLAKPSLKLDQSRRFGIGALIGTPILLFLLAQVMRWLSRMIEGTEPAQMILIAISAFISFLAAMVIFLFKSKLTAKLFPDYRLSATIRILSFPMLCAGLILPMEFFLNPYLGCSHIAENSKAVRMCWELALSYVAGMTIAGILNVLTMTASNMVASRLVAVSVLRSGAYLSVFGITGYEIAALIKLAAEFPKDSMERMIVEVFAMAVTITLLYLITRNAK